MDMTRQNGTFFNMASACACHRWSLPTPTIGTDAPNNYLNVPFCTSAMPTNWHPAVPLLAETLANSDSDRRSLTLSPVADSQLGILPDLDDVFKLNGDVTVEQETRKSKKRSGKNERVSSRRNKPLPAAAVRILQAWFEQHKTQPYPLGLEKRALAESCKLTTRQVTSWFANKRNRTGNTRNKKKRAQIITELNAVHKNLVNERQIARTKFYQTHGSGASTYLQHLDRFLHSCCSQLGSIIRSIIAETQDLPAEVTGKKQKS